MIKNSSLNKNIKVISTDILNKFLLTSSFQNINVKKIKFKFFSNDFTSISLANDDNNLITKVNSLAMSYLLLGSFPFVTFVKKKIVKKMDNDLKEDFFILDMEISNKHIIYQFFLKLIEEYEFFENSLSVDNLNSIVIQENQKFSYNTKISMNQIFEQQEFFNVSNIDKIFMSTNFIFHPIIKQLKNNLSIKDMLYYKTQYL